jgi:hypothetical protein
MIREASKNSIALLARRLSARNAFCLFVCTNLPNSLNLIATACLLKSSWCGDNNFWCCEILHYRPWEEAFSLSEKIDLLLQNKLRLCHFIPRTFHYVSARSVLISTSLRCRPSLRTHSYNLARNFPVSTSPCFLVSLKSASELRSWGRPWPRVYWCTLSLWGAYKGWNLLLICDPEVIYDPRSTGVHFRFEVFTKAVICFRSAILRSAMTRGLLVYIFALKCSKMKWSQSDQANV